MRSLVRFVLAACGIVFLIGVQSAEAQVTGPVEFATTFPFTVGNTTVPAGSYTIRPDADNPQILELTGPRTAVSRARKEVTEDLRSRVMVKVKRLLARISHPWGEPCQARHANPTGFAPHSTEIRARAF